MRAVIPGGVRARCVHSMRSAATPIFVARAEGAFLDEDGNAFIDYVGSWGPMILGHAHPRGAGGDRRRGVARHELRRADRARGRAGRARARGTCRRSRWCGFVSSGTEATMSALRLARGFTGPPKIVKFDGCYHGHADCLLVAAGSGVATLGIPGCAGRARGRARPTRSSCRTTTCRPSSGSSRRTGATIAAVIVEPVAGNMGLVAAAPGYLEACARSPTSTARCSIFDEVMTGFRVA